MLDYSQIHTFELLQKCSATVLSGLCPKNTQLLSSVSDPSPTSCHHLIVAVLENVDCVTPLHPLRQIVPGYHQPLRKEVPPYLIQPKLALKLNFCQCIFSSLSIFRYFRDKCFILHNSL
jgi:hypothetical protein